MLKKGFSLKNLKGLTSESLRFYLCGLTPYTAPHIGNYKTYMLSFIVKNIFEKLLQKKTIFLTNFTDLDDNLLQLRRRENVSTQKIVQTVTQAFLENCKELGLPVFEYVPISTIITEIYDRIQILLQKRLAKRVADGIVFVMNDQLKKEYGALANITTTEHFYLWKLRRDQNRYNSPFGLGIPGWHIQCAVLIGKYFKQGLFLHFGGRDLIFPHHENEKILFSRLFANEITKNWLHFGLVDYEGQKMSKSKGNIVTLETFGAKYPKKFLVFLFCMKKYSKPFSFSYDEADDLLFFYKKLGALYQFIKECPALPLETMSFDLLDDIYELNFRKAILFVYDFIKNVKKTPPFKVTRAEKNFITLFFEEILLIF
jgi:cysteinyl-tRNA synthetase